MTAGNRPFNSRLRRSERLSDGRRDHNESQTQFRRRTTTQASLPGQDAVLLLLFGLLRSGQVKLRALVGYQEMDAVTAAA